MYGSHQYGAPPTAPPPRSGVAGASLLAPAASGTFIGASGGGVAAPYHLGGGTGVFQPPSRGGMGGGAFGGSGENTVLCRLHNKRRLRNQMMEVKPDVWECGQGNQCKVGGGPMGSGPAGAAGAGAPGTTGVTTSSSAAIDVRVAAVNFRAPTAAAAAPIGSAARRPAAAVGQFATAAASWGAASGAAGAQLTHDVEVWCCRTGKRVPRHSCRSIDGGNAWVCVDQPLLQSLYGSSSPSSANDRASTRLSLDSVAELYSRGCDAVLCSRHNRMRNVLCLRPDEARGCYHCTKGSECTIVPALAPLTTDATPATEHRPKSGGVTTTTQAGPMTNEATRSGPPAKGQAPRPQPATSVSAAATAGSSGGYAFGGYDSGGHFDTNNARDATGSISGEWASAPHADLTNGAKQQQQVQAAASTASVMLPQSIGAKRARAAADDDDMWLA